MIDAADGREDVPVSVWLPETPPEVVVLLGYGLGAHREHDTVVPVVRGLCARGAAVLAPDLPLHGTRDPEPGLSPLERAERWQEFWVHGGIETLRREWDAVLAHAAQRFDPLPICYFGLSLGTQYGVVFLAGQTRIRAAALGLFGSHPAPKTPVMNRFAPEVVCPAVFLIQLDDELHSVASARHLFASLGSEEKRLIESPGRHAAVPANALDRACDFVCAVSSP